MSKSDSTLRPAHRQPPRDRAGPLGGLAVAVVVLHNLVEFLKAGTFRGHCTVIASPLPGRLPPGRGGSVVARCLEDRLTRVSRTDLSLNRMAGLLPR